MSVDQHLISDQWILDALAEDVGTGDKTTRATIDDDVKATGRFLAKQDLVVCGLSIVQRLFTLLDQQVKVDFSHQDGNFIKQGTVFCTAYGPAHVLLQGERTALNILQRLSGISTLTYQYTNIIKGTATQILDTRKTLPHYRNLEKYAVRCGGGSNHRMRLDDQMMIKDNHIAANAGDVKQTIKKAKAMYPETFVIVEIADQNQIEAAIKAGADRLLLDNMSDQQIQACQAIIQKRIPVEVSGGITKERVADLAALGVDYISIGVITHGARAVDISMKIG